MFRLDNLACEVVLRGSRSGVLTRMAPVHRTFACIALSHQVRKSNTKVYMSFYLFLISSSSLSLSLSLSLPL